MKYPIFKVKFRQEKISGRCLIRFVLRSFFMPHNKKFSIFVYDYFKKSWFHPILDQKVTFRTTRDQWHLENRRNGRINRFACSCRRSSYTSFFLASEKQTHAQKRLKQHWYKAEIYTLDYTFIDCSRNCALKTSQYNTLSPWAVHSFHVKFSATFISFNLMLETVLPWLKKSRREKNIPPRTASRCEIMI